MSDQQQSRQGVKERVAEVKERVVEVAQAVEAVLTPGGKRSDEEQLAWHRQQIQEIERRKAGALRAQVERALAELFKARTLAGERDDVVAVRGRLLDAHNLVQKALEALS